jgi:flagellar motor switch protein FliN/FliY
MASPMLVGSYRTRRRHDMSEKSGPADSGSDRPLSQSEIDALLQSLAANDKAEVPAPAAGDESLPTETEQPGELATQPRTPTVRRPLPAKLERLANAPLEVTVELGRGLVTVGEALAWGPGSVIVLDKGWTEPVDISINGLHAGRGRVVVSESHFGVVIESWGG